MYGSLMPCINRCGVLHDSSNPHTQCWLDSDHAGSHRRYVSGDSEHPVVEWQQTPNVVIQLLDRVLAAKAPNDAENPPTISRGL